MNEWMNEQNAGESDGVSWGWSTFLGLRMRACELRVSLPSARSADSGLMHAGMSGRVVLRHTAHCTYFGFSGIVGGSSSIYFSGAPSLLGRLGSFARV